MNFNRLLVAFLCLLNLSFVPVDNLTAKQVVQKVADKIKKESHITYNLSYNLYLDYKTNTVHENYTGFALKYNNVNYFKLKETEIISFSDVSLKINHEQKQIVVEKVKNADSPIDLDKYLKHFTITFLEQNDKYYVCQLIPPKISQYMIAKVIFYINKKDFTLEKQKLYFVEAMEYKAKNGEIKQSVPRVEISFLQRKKDIKRDEILTKKETYFINKKSLELQKKFAKYKLYKS